MSSKIAFTALSLVIVLGSASVAGAAAKKWGIRFNADTNSGARRTAIR
jgi:hypothetical protein